MLKSINNDILKIHGFSISSFIIKSIVLWLAEKCSQHSFRPDTLFSWIVMSLLFLKRAAQQNDLPYYMIPKRNLLVEKVKDSDRLLLELTLSDMLKSGPAFLYNVEWYSHMKPGELGILRQELESYDLLTMASLLELLRRIGKRDISVNEPTLSQMFHDFLELQR